ncbi:hypothetical protein PMAYCL1PPCAC_01532, partial [Pristionchus mayeri]
FCPSTGTSRPHNTMNITSSEKISKDCTEDVGKKNHAVCCRLCGEMTSSYCFSPKDPLRARQFYDNLINLTPGQLEYANRLSQYKLQNVICRRHVKEILKEELPKDNSWVRYCLLCREPTSAYFIFPMDPTSYQQYINNLIGVTTEQRNKIESFANRNVRGFICEKHSRYSVTNTSSTTIFSPATGDPRPNFQRKMNVSRKEVPELSLIVQNMPMPAKCYLCLRFYSEYVSTSSNKDARDEFLARLVVKTPQQRERMTELVRNGAEANFCLNHFSKKADAVKYCPSTGMSRPLVLLTPTSSVMPSETKMCRRKCVVCRQFRNENEMREFTKNSTRRTLWVDAVRS